MSSTATTTHENCLLKMFPIRWLDIAVGRGNVDAWEKYIEPFESDNCKKKFNQYGGIGNKMVTDDEMVEILQESKFWDSIFERDKQSGYGGHILLSMNET